MIVSVDPGVRDAGVAVWRSEGVLFEASLVRSDSWLSVARKIRDSLGGIDVEELVIERPQVYVASRSKGDPNDLITLALMAGATVADVTNGRDISVVEYRPAQWKGQVPKHVMTQRTIRSLSDDERDRVQPCPRSLAHNVWDAIGLGLYHLRGQRRYGHQR